MYVGNKLQKIHLSLLKCTYTVESRKYAPPFLHASIRQNRGGGLCTDRDIAA